MKLQKSSLALATALFVGWAGLAAAQNSGNGSPNNQGSINDPTSPASSNRGDPGTEPINPNTGGATMGQGTRPAPDATVGQGGRAPSTLNRPAEPNGPYSPIPDNPGQRSLPDSANPNGR
jgi:hypothetical protein